MGWVTLKDVATFVADIIKYTRSERNTHPLELSPTEIQYAEKVAEIQQARTILKAKSDELLADVAARQMAEIQRLDYEAEKLRLELASAVAAKKKRKKHKL